MHSQDSKFYFWMATIRKKWKNDIIFYDRLQEWTGSLRLISHLSRSVRYWYTKNALFLCTQGIGMFRKYQKNLEECVRYCTFPNSTPYNFVLNTCKLQKNPQYASRNAMYEYYANIDNIGQLAILLKLHGNSMHKFEYDMGTRFTL